MQESKAFVRISVFPEDPEPEEALGYLLLDNVILLGDYWYHKDRTEAQKREISINVICSDTFSYACADCEPLPFGELLIVYQLWRKDPLWGPTYWCVKQRKQRPIQPVLDELIARGYDIESALTLDLDQSSQPEEGTEPTKR